jgi:hypothetical protein
MIVKKQTGPIEKVRNMLKDQGGILKTADLAKQGIPRTYLSILEQQGEIR